ncbi:hypothetical protein D9598_16975 [Roseomonas sp. KE0001]|nr:hypothetical protein [Roseomonas sp. KE0001]
MAARRSEEVVVTAAEELGALLDSTAPEVSGEQAEALVARFYGLEAEARPLSGERDRNFHLRDGAGAEYVLRVIHPAEDPGVSDFQSRALLHLAQAAPDLPVPRLHRPLSGAAAEALWEEEGAPPRRLRLLDYLLGRPLHLAPPGAAQRQAIGECLARLDLGLGGFRHPSESHPLMWDIQRAARLRPLIRHLPQIGDRGLAAAMLDRFEQRALPRLPRLRAQVIHNDFNPHNILTEERADDRIAGIIDFGDMVRAPLVQDLATAAAYQITSEGHPLEAPAQLAAAYHALLPLVPEEIDVLPDLIAARLVVSVAISGWRATRQPANADYILRNYARSLSGLRRLGALPPDEARLYLRERLDTP